MKWGDLMTNKKVIVKQDAEKPMPRRILTATQVRAELREKAEYEGSQRKLAKLIGVSAAFLNDILLGKREPSGKPVAFLGLERHVDYRRKK